MVVQFMCEFLVLLTINMLWHAEVMFNQLLNLLERYYVYLHLCLLSLSKILNNNIKIYVHMLVQLLYVFE